VGGGRGLLAIVAGAAVLLVATVAVVIMAGNRPAQSYPPGSPEATMQAYLQAAQARDVAAAFQLFSKAARSGITVDDYRRQSADYGGFGDPGEGPSRRVYIDRTTITGDRAELATTIEETWVQGLNTSRYRRGQIVTLVREDGAWRFERLFYGLEMNSFNKEAPAAIEK
jgi:hypothetical protein